ncbi:MAG TPA: hypothetical protein VGH97_11270 [Thermoanaerobaculia bacterium]|jgi:hypothetical protein
MTRFGPSRCILLLSVIGSLACGKKGDPQPPLPRGPHAVSDLAIEQEGDDAVLTFTFPDRLLTGAPLTDLSSIEVYRVIKPSPELTSPRRPSAGPAAGSVPSSSTGGAGPLHLPGEGARREATNVRLAEEAFYRDAKKAAVLSLSAIAEHTRGASVIYRDPLSELWSRGLGGDPLAYAVISVRRNGERSPVSNIVTLTPAVAPGAPVLAEPLPEEGRLCLEWQAPETDVLGHPAAIAGYRVYRRGLSEDEYGPPLNAEPVKGTSYVDATAPYGVPLVYTVRAVLEGNPKVEGLPAEEIPVLFADVYPPPAPTRLDALSEGNLVRLLWDPVDAPDLAGYLVFRSKDGGAPERLTKEPLTDPFFTDETARQGARYRYTVRAIDRNGNQSAPSPEATAEPF